MKLRLYGLEVGKEWGSEVGEMGVEGFNMGEVGEVEGEGEIGVC